MLPDKQLVNTRMYLSEIKRLNHLLEEKGFDKQQFLIRAFRNFNKMSKKKQNDSLKYLEFDRVKTETISFRAKYGFADELNKKAKDLNLTRSQLLRMVVVSGIGNSE